jgi:hypothetical protein
MSLAIAELFKGLGHTVSLLNIRSPKTWWDDCTPLQKLYDVIQMEDLSGELERFDIVFEVAQLVLKPTVRQAIANKSVWIIRKPFVITEIESTIYPLAVHERDFTGVSEAWLLNDVTSPDDITAIETLTGLKVRNVPFVWTPILAEAQNRIIGALQWRGNANAPFFIRMADTNQSSLSSSTIPLVILREIARKKLPVDGWALHNGENLAKSKFFKENVLAHCNVPDVPYNFFGRQRIIDWINDPKSVVLSHNRFVPLKLANLEAAWVGLPLIHNSTILRDMGCGLELLYYHANSVTGATEALNRVIYKTE